MGTELPKKANIALTRNDLTRIEDGLQSVIEKLEPSIHNSDEGNASIRLNKMKYTDLLKRIQLRRKKSFQ